MVAKGASRMHSIRSCSRALCRRRAASAFQGSVRAGDSVGGEDVNGATEGE